MSWAPEPAIQVNPRLEGLRLAVQLYSRRDGATGAMILHAADIFGDWLAACPPHLPPASDKILAALSTILANQEKTMTALTDLQAADSALQAEVATFLADIAAKLSESDPDIESVVADINAQVASLQAADPNAAPVVTPTPNAGVSN
jgi:hypothetical protein